MTNRASAAAKVTVWIAIAGAVIGVLTFAHNGLSQVEQIPAMRADIDTLKAHEVSDKMWKHDMAYMACVNFSKTHPTNEQLATCKSATK